MQIYSSLIIVTIWSLSAEEKWIFYARKYLQRMLASKYASSFNEPRSTNRVSGINTDDGYGRTMDGQQPAAPAKACVYFSRAATTKGGAAHRDKVPAHRDEVPAHEHWSLEASKALTADTFHSSAAVSCIIQRTLQCQHRHVHLATRIPREHGETCHLIVSRPPRVCLKTNNKSLCLFLKYIAQRCKKTIECK